MIHNDLLTQWSHIRMGKFRTNIFLISITSNYFGVVKNCKILTFNVNFLCQKSFSFFSLNDIILGAHFSLLTFFEKFNFYSTLFSKMTSTFWRLRSSSKLLISKKYYHGIYPLVYALNVLEDHCEPSQLWSITTLVTLLPMPCFLNKGTTFYVSNSFWSLNYISSSSFLPHRRDQYATLEQSIWINLILDNPRG